MNEEFKDADAIKVCDFDIATPCDIEQAIEGFGGQIKMFFKMLNSFESTALNKTMKDIIEPYEKEEHKAMKD